MDYVTIFLVLFVAFIVFKVASWVISTTIKLAFTAAFLTLAVLVMSSSVGLV